jgi:hypothetical protein
LVSAIVISRYQKSIGGVTINHFSSSDRGDGRERLGLHPKADVSCCALSKARIACLCALVGPMACTGGKPYHMTFVNNNELRTLHMSFENACNNFINLSYDK